MLFEAYLLRLRFDALDVVMRYQLEKSAMRLYQKRHTTNSTDVVRHRICLSFSSVTFNLYYCCEKEKMAVSILKKNI